MCKVTTYFANDKKKRSFFTEIVYRVNETVVFSVSFLMNTFLS
ncbi:hypothetical protein HMPREF2532_01541 [Bacteroides ovatus]|uniref:Uncharacterized protein n=1 Tax=Bacteroides ovatus (strain ATCC 8483 / DSM 1896 / JCM 5824 / BCRC 10623 / CCUG 4943 / NCTC 11153) TaxID=411476 RepID=A0AAN3ACY8_BACO1|nr:hypothetical protein BACOVA_00351 [Bacteroides ovatus ATCC 8483]KXT48809.1 hypothetical protein HMPREF2532_01541 [Bacteroides ovatus]